MYPPPPHLPNPLALLYRHIYTQRHPEGMVILDRDPKTWVGERHFERWRHITRWSPFLLPVPAAVVHADYYFKINLRSFSEGQA